MTSRHKRIVARSSRGWRPSSRPSRALRPRTSSSPRRHGSAPYAERRGSLGRCAWGVVAIAFGTTSSIASARRVLDMVAADNVRDTARNLLDELTTERGDLAHA